jgi:large subunit ribosomal protein L35
MVRAKVRREVIATRYHETGNRPSGTVRGNLCGTLVFSRNIVMPKLKTHKGASKRFKKTATGKIVRQHAFARHILTSKGRKRKNKLHQSTVADDSDQAKLARMIPY